MLRKFQSFLKQSLVNEKKMDIMSNSKEWNVVLVGATSTGKSSFVESFIYSACRHHLYVKNGLMLNLSENRHNGWHPLFADPDTFDRVETTQSAPLPDAIRKIKLTRRSINNSDTNTNYPIFNHFLQFYDTQGATFDWMRDATNSHNTSSLPISVIWNMLNNAHLIIIMLNSPKGIATEQQIAVLNKNLLRNFLSPELSSKVDGSNRYIALCVNKIDDHVDKSLDTNSFFDIYYNYLESLTDRLSQKYTLRKFLMSCCGFLEDGRTPNWKPEDGGTLKKPNLWKPIRISETIFWMLEDYEKEVMAGRDIDFISYDSDL